MKKPTNFVDYIFSYPVHVKKMLIQLRFTIVRSAPKAEEVISYDMPAFKFYGMLLNFAAYIKHIGLYPFSSAIKEFAKEIEGYKSAKGSVQFPLDEPLPLKLISKIVKFRVKENIEKENAKGKL